MSKVTLGGDRLGSGNKNKLWLHNYERSTHDLSYVWRSTMSAGTLVPFMSQVALPGDTFDIELNADVLTHPTIGPLFGSYKLQIDIFQVPIRLYQAMLHMNMLGIGMDMSSVLLPQLEIKCPGYDNTKPIDNQHTNPSSLLAYLGIRGNGFNNPAGTSHTSIRQFNAVPFLAYFDIYKQYYANKQEEIGAIIHKDVVSTGYTLTNLVLKYGIGSDITVTSASNDQEWTALDNSVGVLTFTTETPNFQPSKCVVTVGYDDDIEAGQLISIESLFGEFQDDIEANKIYCYAPTEFNKRCHWWGKITYNNNTSNTENPDIEPALVTFPLSNIDDMRMNILSAGTTQVIIKNSDPAPYGYPLQWANSGYNLPDYSKYFAQEGLCVKTYNSDLFNNWISTEWIDGVDGISAITAIDTTEGSFTIDELNLSKKIYDMLNRIAVSGGSYDDWLDAVYTHDRQRNAESPMYLGGLIQSVVFQEVVSNAQTGVPETEEFKPLGTLAGRGKITQNKKGGKVIAKIDEPSYIIGICSLTPRVDYSQGNSWDCNLKTMNDLHKPALDAIGFQDLITDQMAWFDTPLDGANGDKPLWRSAGKQPAWINYMTNINVVRGNFADTMQQMYMTLNRRYEAQIGTTASIKDLSTYIDPVKFNHIFADKRRDAQNFWVQLGIGITARRKMSAKVMPNL